MKLKALVACSIMLSAVCVAKDTSGSGVIRNAAFQQCLVNSGNIDRADTKNYTDVDEAIDSCATAAYDMMVSSCGRVSDGNGCSLEKAAQVVALMNDIKAVKQ